MHKIYIINKKDLDDTMHFYIGGSWDYKNNFDNYPKEYPCFLLLSKNRQDLEFVYKSDFPNE